MLKPKSSLIQELQSRGYIHQCTNIEELDNSLENIGSIEILSDLDGR